MPDVEKRLAGPVALASGDNTVFTVDPGHNVKIQRLVIVNNSTAKVTVKVGIGASTDGSLITPDLIIQKKAVVDKTVDVMLAGDEFLVANADTTGSTITVNGYDQYPHL